MTFADQVYCTNEYEIHKDEQPEVKKRKRLKLSQALAVLAIKPSSFYTLYTAHKLPQLRLLLETALTERVNSFQYRKQKQEANKVFKELNKEITINSLKTSHFMNKSEIDPEKISTKLNGPVNLEFLSEITHLLDKALKNPRSRYVNSKKDIFAGDNSKKNYQPHIDDSADLTTIHEAYQYLMKTYVDDVDLHQKSSQSNMFKVKTKKHGKDKNDVEEGSVTESNHEQMLKEIEELVEKLDFPESDSSSSSSGSSSRRGSKILTREGTNSSIKGNRRGSTGTVKTPKKVYSKRRLSGFHV